VLSRRAPSPWIFLAVSLLVVAADQVLPGAWMPPLLLDALGIAAVAAVFLGIQRNRPACAAAWRLLGVGTGLLVAGDLVWDVAGLKLGIPGPENTAASVLYLVGYPFLVAAVLLLGRARTPARRGRTIADGIVVAATALVPCWQLWIGPTIHHLHGPILDRAASVAYPMLDVALIGAVASVLCTARFRDTSLWLVLGGMGATLVADVCYLTALRSGGGSGTNWYDSLWTIGYVLVGVAALHPSMADVGRHAGADDARFDRARVALIGSALFVAPVLVLVGSAGGSDVSPVVIAVSMTVVVAVVVWRLASLAGDADRASRALRQSERRFRSLVQHAADVIVVLDPDGTVTYVSPAIEDTLGIPAAQLVGTDVGDLLHPDDLPLLTATLAAAASHPGRAYVVSARGRHANGTYRHFEGSVTGHVDDVDVHGVVVNVRDVTERTQIDALRHAETRLLEMMARGAPLDDTLQALVAIVEPLLSGAVCSVRLVAPDGALGRVVAPNLPGAYLDAVRDVRVPVDQFLGNGDGLMVTEDLAVTDGWESAHRRAALENGLRAYWALPIRSPDGTRVLGMFSVYHREPHTPADSERAVVGRATHLAAIAFDRADAADRLGFLALHDPLTELPNRTLVVDRLTQVLLRLDRRRSTTAVLVLDLDRFTVINDSFGHDAGDELLVAVANRLVETVRPGDTVGRLGGDEFVIVCEDAGDDEGAEAIAERLAHAVAEPVSIARGDVVVTASVGIAISRSTSDRADGLLRDADAALYRAKAKGGARHELFDEAMHTSAVVRLLTERALRRAIDHDELRVWYQPQIDIATRETVAVEALVRWQHPVRGIVGPNEFIDVAEETGLIVPIGAWVLDQACAQTAAWRGPTSLGRPRTVSVNLSARQLARPDLPARIAAILRDRGTDPQTVCLEITESVLLDDLESTADAVRALKDLGLRLAIDDFGTGYSSLAYLKRFSFDELKIDRSFVDGVGEDETDDAIVAATIDLAHALGLVVAAEGIETEAQFERLAELGCDLVQGYLFARPQPASALTEFAAGRWNRRIA